MTDPSVVFPSRPPGATAALVLADGRVFWGQGLGAATATTGEVCFCTSMTGYQETLSDPSYAGQIITFTFPHIGNVGANPEDVESTTPAARGLIMRAALTEPANWRAREALDAWLSRHGLPAIAGVDTRQLTRAIRDQGAPTGVLAHAPDGAFDLPGLLEHARAWPGLEGMDLAREVSCQQVYEWTQTPWTLAAGYGRLDTPRFHVVALDYGIKHNILRQLAGIGARVTVVPAQTPAERILDLDPDGIFLGNGPGDPAATGVYAEPVIRALVDSGRPVMGICLGHQMLARALGARTHKMAIGHRGANHPVRDLATGRVTITSQNHGFAVDRDTLPAGVVETHSSLFDGSVEGLKVAGKPVFSVQFHPEASPGPHDASPLFQQFADLMAAHA